MELLPTNFSLTENGGIVEIFLTSSLHLKDRETEAREGEAQEGTGCWCHNWTRRNPLAPGSRIVRAHYKKNWLFVSSRN